MEELGSGFYLAMHDLEIRGAGEVLGDNQSGEMNEIGFQLYSDMLNEAVRSLKAGKEPDLAAPLATTTEINLHVPALLPADFCGDVHTNSGIPNHAFYAACVALKGNSWDKAAPIWYKSLSLLTPNASFADMASATAQTAILLYGADSPEQKAVRAAWKVVGVD